MARPGAEVRVASPLRGTWIEFLDVYRDVLVRLGREDALASLRGYAASFPEASAVIHQMEQAGLTPVTVQRDHWELVFRSAREFFYAPVVEFGPLARWKQIAGKGAEVQDTFLAVKQAIDTYFSGQSFSVSIEAGLFIGQKPRNRAARRNGARISFGQQASHAQQCQRQARLRPAVRRRDRRAGVARWPAARRTPWPQGRSRSRPTPAAWAGNLEVKSANGKA